MTPRVLVFTCLITLISLPAIVFAASRGGSQEFIPIQPLPVPGGGGELITNQGFAFYVNSLFKYSLAAGAVLAVIYIAIGGFEYMLSEAMESKKDGRARITHALYGLGILLMVTIVLYIINPNILCLDVFNSARSCK
jgi:hypothetical protein